MMDYAATAGLSRLRTLRGLCLPGLRVYFARPWNPWDSI